MRDLAVRRWFDGVDQVGKLDSILNEEDWDVVANDIYIDSQYSSITSVSESVIPKLPSSV